MTDIIYTVLLTKVIILIAGAYSTVLFKIILVLYMLRYYDGEILSANFIL